MTDNYLQFGCTHYGLYGNAPVASRLRLHEESWLSVLMARFGSVFAAASMADSLSTLSTAPKVADAITLCAQWQAWSSFFVVTCRQLAKVRSVSR